jgi:hypothetical protein
METAVDNCVHDLRAECQGLQVRHQGCHQEVAGLRVLPVPLLVRHAVLRVVIELRHTAPELVPCVTLVEHTLSECILIFHNWRTRKRFNSLVNVWPHASSWYSTQCKDGVWSKVLLPRNCNRDNSKNYEATKRTLPCLCRVRVFQPSVRVLHVQSVQPFHHRLVPSNLSEQ